MRSLIFIFLSGIFLSADVYYAKLEPLETYSYKSATSGKVVFSNTKLEGALSDGDVVVKIDDELTKKNINELKEMLKNTKERVDALSQIVKIKSDNYERIKNLTTKSQLEKERELSDYLNSKVQYLAAREQMGSLKMQLDKEEDALKDKNIYAKGLYIYKIYVKNGDYVSAGVKLFDAMDTSRGKLTLFVKREDMQILKNSEFFINDKKSVPEVAKMYNVSDNEFVSSYKLELIIPAQNIFSELVKVEIRESK